MVVPKGLTTQFRRATRIYDWLKYDNKKHLKRRREKKQAELLPSVSEPGVFLDAYPIEDPFDRAPNQLVSGELRPDFGVLQDISTRFG